MKGLRNEYRKKIGVEIPYWSLFGQICFVVSKDENSTEMYRISKV